MSIYYNERGFTEQDWRDTSVKWSNDLGDLTHRIDYPLNGDSIVFDVGGYVGDWAQDIYCRHTCKIHVYEPVKHYASVIRRKFLFNEDVIINEFGLAHVDANDVDISFNQEASSLFKKSENMDKCTLKQAAPIINTFDKIDLMKINIEGAEYSLLDHMIDEGVVPKIGNLQIQFHIFVKNYEARREWIRMRLSETHELTYDYPFIWENWKLKETK